MGWLQGLVSTERDGYSDNPLIPLLSCAELNTSGESVGTVCFGGNAGVSLPGFGLRQPAAALSITACCDTTSRTFDARQMRKFLRGSQTETSRERQGTEPQTTP